MTTAASQKSKQILTGLTTELRKILDAYLLRSDKDGTALNTRLALPRNPLWDDELPLLSLLSHIVTRVSGVDTGAAARLLDSIICALPIDSTDIFAIVPRVASQASVGTSDILPLVIPALASAMNIHINQCDSCNDSHLPNTLDNIVAQCCIVISLLIAAEEYITRTEVQTVLDHIASISCLAAQRLYRSLCLISRDFQGIHYQLQIPCVIADFQSSASSGLPRQNTNGGSESKLPWDITTVTSAGDCTFSSSSSALSQNLQTAQVPVYSASSIVVNAQPATLPSQYGQGQLISASTSFLPNNPNLPAYSGKIIQILYPPLQSNS